MDSIDLLRSVPLASSGKGLSEKVATILILLNLDQAKAIVDIAKPLFHNQSTALLFSFVSNTHFPVFAVTLILKVRVLVAQEQPAVNDYI